MASTNLGRVQGAGMFTTTAASGTSVASGTISPTNISPLAGDSVIFPNGDVRNVTAVSGGTITCGDVVTNIKGEKGDTGDTGPQGPQGPAATTDQILNLVYPVGSIYMSVNNASPQTFIGGTWVAWGAGRVPVSVDTTDSNFNTVEKTGGAETVTLTTSQMPSHTHTITESFSGSNQQGYVGLVSGNTNDMNPSGPFDQVRVTRNGVWGSGNGSRSNSLRFSYTPSGTVTCTAASTGSGSSHNNLQPYITCYMWKRTA